MQIVVALVIGAVVGWLASLIMKTEGQMGLLGSIAVGLVGSSLGFWVAAKIGIDAKSTVARWAVAVGGAVLFIVILRALGVLK